MSEDFLLDMALRHFEFDEDQIARIKAAVPKAAYVARLVKNNRTVANELIDVIDMVLTKVSQREGR